MRVEFGAFGKIPALGDFFRIGVAASFVEPWDQWLQAGIVGVRTALGEHWDRCFMQAPIWRFTLSAGLAGPAPAQGVVMPSVDRVGRQFPLTLVAPLAGGRSALMEHFTAEPRFQALEDIALDALDDAMTREELSARLGAVPAAAPEADCQVASGPGRLVITSTQQNGGLPELAAELTARNFTAPSIWSASFDTGSRLLAIEGLPNLRQMQGLFDLNAPVWQDGASQ